VPLEKDIENTLNPLLAAFDDTLQADIAGQIAEINISGTAEMITWGKTKGGVPDFIRGATYFASCGLGKETRSYSSNPDG